MFHYFLIDKLALCNLANTSGELISKGILGCIGPVVTPEYLLFFPRNFKRNAIKNNVKLNCIILCAHTEYVVS